MTPPASIVARFFSGQRPEKIAPLGNGLINDTFLLKFPTQCWVMQRINRHVFPHPEKIIHNLNCLQTHVDNHSPLKIPKLLNTPEGAFLAYDEQGSAWRIMQYIDNSESRETLSCLDEAASVGNALAQFHQQFHCLDARELEDTLPGFHCTPLYLEHYDQILARQQSTSANPKFSFCREFIEHYRNKAGVLENARQQGLIKPRVSHGDPKLNNFLFKKNSAQIIALIDLDTVKANLIHYDIADCVRSCCQTDGHLLDMALANQLLQHYIQQAQSLFSPTEVEFLYPALELLPFELGLRFFSDYLTGNPYFKSDYPEHNLDRAADQFLFCTHVQHCRNELKTLIQSAFTSSE